MCTVLLPVDGSDSSRRAVELVIRLHARLAPLAVHLVHVEVPPLPILEDVSAQAPRAPAADVSASAKAMLDAASIPYTTHVEQGYVGSTIVAYAKARHCDAIVMGTRGMGSTENLLGSIARQVIQLAEVPVTLVK